MSVVDRAWVCRDTFGRYVRWELSMFCKNPTHTITLAQMFTSRERARQYLRNMRAPRGQYRILRVEVKS